jgi:hypothetical protein
MPLGRVWVVLIRLLIKVNNTFPGLSRLGIVVVIFELATTLWSLRLHYIWVRIDIIRHMIIKGITIGHVIIIVHITKTRSLGGERLGVVVVIFELAKKHGWCPRLRWIWEGRDIGPTIIVTVHIKDRTRILGGVRLGDLVVILERAKTTITVELAQPLQQPFKILLEGANTGIMLTDGTSASFQIILKTSNSDPVTTEGTSVSYQIITDLTDFRSDVKGVFCVCFSRSKRWWWLGRRGILSLSIIRVLVLLLAGPPR